MLIVDVFTLTYGSAQASKYHMCGNFCQFGHLLSLAKFYHANFLTCVNDYIEDMADLYHLVRIYSHQIFKGRKAL